MRITAFGLSILFLFSGCGSTPQATLKIAKGPDAAIAADVCAAGALQWVTQQPVWDRGVDGDATTLDPRILIAVLEPGRATWLLAARATLQEAVDLLESMRSDIQPDAEARTHVLAVEVFPDPPPVSQAGCRVIGGGHWKWGGMVHEGEQDLFVMSLLGRSGEPAARVTMDAATAGDLYREIDRTIRVKTPMTLVGVGEEAARR